MLFFFSLCFSFFFNVQFALMLLLALLSILREFHFFLAGYN